MGTRRHLTIAELLVTHAGHAEDNLYHALHVAGSHPSRLHITDQLIVAVIKVLAGV